MKSKQLKVLFLVNIPSPYRVDFFNKLGENCDLTVLFERTASDERESAWYNNNFSNFNAVFLKGIKIKGNTALCFSVLTYLKKDMFDIIVVGGYSTPTGMLAIEVLKHRKIPFILNVDGGLIRQDNSLKYKLKKRYIGSATYWLSTGSNTTDYLVNYGAKRDNVFVYPFTSILQKDILESPIEQDLKEQFKNNLNITEEKVILSIGRFINGKGFDVLLEACKSIPDSYGIYIVGGKPTQEYLKLRHELKLSNVHFIDFKSKDALKEYYMASDLFVLPTREDIWGLVINEAIAYGLPVITTDKCVAGLELIKDYENGFIVPVNDPFLLAKRINEILEDRLMQKTMSKESLKRAHKYTIENMALAHMNIFESVLDKG